MLRRITPFAFLLLGALPASAHEPVLLHASQATPGLRLEVIEVAKSTAADAAKYRLRATGFPHGIVFGVWTKDFGHSFHQAASGLQVDDSGNVVSIELDDTDRPRRLDEMTFESGPYPRGAIWELAIVSADRAFSAFASVIPRPITAEDGRCSLSLQLVSHRGERFLAAGTGFAPGDDVVTELRYAGRVIQKRQRISAEGRLPPDLISHGTPGTDRHARYAVKSRSCEVAVEYEWGEPAFHRR